jgi:hypothetical protein
MLHSAQTVTLGTSPCMPLKKLACSIPSEQKCQKYDDFLSQHALPCNCSNYNSSATKHRGRWPPTATMLQSMQGGSHWALPMLDLMHSFQPHPRKIFRPQPEHSQLACRGRSAASSCTSSSTTHFALYSAQAQLPDPIRATATYRGSYSGRSGG